MFTRLSNSWELVKASWGVLRADKELVVFPIVSGITSLIVLITFAVPLFLSGLFEAMFAEDFGPARLGRLRDHFCLLLGVVLCHPIRQHGPGWRGHDPARWRRSDDW